MVDIFYPLQWIADKVTYEILRIGPDTHLGASVNFIIYDVMKIFILLAFMIFVVSYIRSYITPEKTRQVLGGKKGLHYHLLASLIGVVTPFCSCSSVPIFIGLVEAGVPLGVTFSFLIASPLVNEAAVAAYGQQLALKQLCIMWYQAFCLAFLVDIL